MSRFSARGCLLFVVSGFGVGYLAGPKGTYGSLLGVGYYFLLRQTGTPVSCFGVAVVGILATIWITGRAEKFFGRKDPEQIILDEIICFPMAMVGSELVFWQLSGNGYFENHPLVFLSNLAIVFVIYRVLDILKPSFLGRVQRLSGGWGIVLDDLLAAICTTVISVVLLFIWFWVKNLSA